METITILDGIKDYWIQLSGMSCETEEYQLRELVNQFSYFIISIAAIICFDT